MITYSNKDYCQTFTIHRMMTCCFSRMETCTLITLHCRLHVLPCARVHLTGKLATKYYESKSCGLNSIVTIAKDSVSPQKLRYWLVECNVCANRLLDSDKPVIDQLPRRLMTVIMAKDAPVKLCFGLIMCAECRWLLLLLSLHVRVKNWVKSIHFCQIQHTFVCCEHSCKLGTDYLNALTWTLYIFSRQNSETFEILLVCPINYRKVISFQKQSVFSPTLNIRSTGGTVVESSKADNNKIILL